LSGAFGISEPLEDSALNLIANLPERCDLLPRCSLHGRGVGEWPKVATKSAEKDFWTFALSLLANDDQMMNPQLPEEFTDRLRTVAFERQTYFRHDLLGQGMYLADMETGAVYVKPIVAMLSKKCLRDLTSRGILRAHYEYVS
jgi:hypothetical protein